MKNKEISHKFKNDKTKCHDLATLAEIMRGLHATLSICLFVLHFNNRRN